jgi:hypothetical protein
LQKLDPKDEKLNTERSADLNKQLIELVDWEKFAPEKGKLNAEQKEKLITEQLEKYTQARMPKLMAATQRYLPGFLFVSMLPREADAHYAGKGVLLGTADKPIFWYRPKDAKTYRVIYADLSVRDADEAPDMPAAQPEKDLLTMFRHYSKLSGGPFPDSLDADSLSRFLEKKFGIEEGQKPGEKQMQEIMATLMKSQPGLLQEYLAISLKFHSGAMYVNSLPPEADVHYAGKGVSLGAADKPIFWYRPKDAKKYRVIYADLSVRDADKAPNVPDAQPAPAQSSPKQ